MYNSHIFASKSGWSVDLLPGRRSRKKISYDFVTTSVKIFELNVTNATLVLVNNIILFVLITIFVCIDMYFSSLCSLLTIAVQKRTFE